MKLTFSVEPSVHSLMAREYEIGERSVTRAMRGAARDLKGQWRGQVISGGLGRRLSNTIRSATYPEHEASMNAAALVWSKAPHIVDAHNRGVRVRSSNGFWLAIPLPAAGRARGNKRTTPLDFERRTGLRLRMVHRPGRTALLVADDARLTKGRGEARLKRGRRRKRDGILTGAQTVPVFVLVPQARLKKRLDLDGAAARVAASLPARIVGGWVQS